MQTLNNFFSVANMIVPAEGPKVVPIKLDFNGISEIEIDGNQIVTQGQLAYIQTVYIDNSENDEPISIVSDLTDQVITCPAGCQGNFNVFMPNNPKFIVRTDGTLIVTIFFCNFPLIPAVWSASGSAGAADHVIIDSAAVPLEVTGVAGDPVEVTGVAGDPVVVEGTVATTIAPITIAENSIAMTGASDILVPSDSNFQYLIILNPAANTGPIQINMGGGDATFSVLEIAVGEYFIYQGPPVATQVTVAGVNTELCNYYMGV